MTTRLHRAPVRIARLARLVCAGGALLCSLVPAPARAAPDASGHTAIVQAFCGTNGDPVAALSQVVAAGLSADAGERRWARDVVDALGNGGLGCTSDARATLTVDGRQVDADTLAPSTAGASVSPYVPSIVMMRHLAVASAELDLGDPDRAKRLAAAQQVEKFFTLLDPQLVGRALHAEHDGAVAAELRLALAERGLNSTVRSERLAAIAAIAGAPSESGRTLLANLLADDTVRADPAVLAAVQSAIADLDRRLAVGHALSVLYSGLSYAGVLLLTALGLSIVFGLMGVINLAHGEFIMLGAYSTYLVEQAFRAWLPASAFGAYIFAALPAAFVMCAITGMLLEFFVIRFLYRRPLETLLATWAVSIALIKLVQVIFGSQNVEFVTPDFLNGGFEPIAGFFVTYNRLFAIAVALAVFGATYAVIRYTKIGLLMRATTQLRDMARCLGVPSERVDRLAFGFGAGLAGLAGVVLTQIANVNPSMGTDFVVDSFMVVVLGGAGSLAGTVVSSFALGEINQFIEPFYGAVAAKVAVLLLIVLIIQKRPQGLFTVRTRV
ncbi:urea ABC transporter permease subunit UrtB [Burkholderia sp. WAC0059]|uniref:urea ABC transporter permease subunit UrtB n=1 Tax=Burkholderia sp. WAC0059 TaxID=2066022 RepID=UPI000C7EC79D|nr:urea ABC transporter permease subunit UrtB [Burkholderia sp. WAC0059]PLZ03044.1 urea ABC transporter permease subunit UrtB [Burkholderia sp. WAC0059]